MPITIAVLLLIIWFAWAYLQTNGKRSPQEQKYRAQTIVARGGPINRQEYQIIFPEACPRCGSRSRYESQTNSARWSCRRCQYKEGLGRLKARQLRVITSPFIEPEISDSIPEPIFSGPGYSQIFVLNNDQTSMEFVAKTLMVVFELPENIAAMIILEAHTKNEQSYIITLPSQEADSKLQIARQMVQDYGQILEFSREDG